MTSQRLRESLAESALKDVGKSLRTAAELAGLTDRHTWEAEPIQCRMYHGPSSRRIVMDATFPDLQLTGPNPTIAECALSQVARAIASLEYPAHSGIWESQVVDALETLDSAISEADMSDDTYLALNDLWENLVQYRDRVFDHLD